jgi:Flp pilus assembly protein TadG
MRQRNTRGGAAIEFAFVLMVLIPLVLGTGAVGVNMVRTLQTVQLARDAGHMYARGLDFSLPGNQTVLYQIGSSLGLSSSSTSSAVVILSALTYVDDTTCAGAGFASGSPAVHTSACANYGKWVFTQRLQFGSTNLRTSAMGSPLTSGPTGVTIASNGKISQSDYCSKSGDVATFNSINPYSNVNNQVSGLPSGQMLYVAEAGGTAWKVSPFVNNASTYSFGLF